MLILQFLFWNTAVHRPVADYEQDYLRVDEPAYHATPMKRFVRIWHASPDSELDVVATRRFVSFTRVLALGAFVVTAKLLLGNIASAVSAVIFLFMPPTLEYGLRLDSWMDSVCFFSVAAFCFLMARKPGEKYAVFLLFLTGFMSALATDAKTTVLLTLIPAVVAFWFTADVATRRTSIFAFLAGIIAGFAAAQPSWIVHPSTAWNHVAYWRTTNSVLPPVGRLELIHAVIFSVPFTIWACTAVGISDIRRNRATVILLLLAASPVAFFMVYRTFPPDGARHLFLVFPFVTILAGKGFTQMPPKWRTVLLVLWFLELWAVQRPAG